jgi:monoterpene epsilon-lactone hydrolase
MSAMLGFDVAAHLLAFNESLGRATTIEDTRRVFETYPIDPSPVVGTIVHEIAEPAGSWFGRPNDNPARRGLYLHGGGYVAGSITTYTGVVSRLAVATRSWIFIPNVPLAPESRFPAAHEVAIQAARHVLRNGPFAPGDSTSLYFAGDSCGASLALATATRFRDEVESNMLTAIVGLSPILDMTASGESYSRCARSDTVVSRELTRHCVATYAPETDPCDPRLSPLFGTFSRLPPVLLQVSEDEAVFDDSTRAALLARQQGCQLEVQTWRGLPHVWHLLAPRLPEAEIAIGRVGRFIERAIGDAA